MLYDTKINASRCYVTLEKLKEKLLSLNVIEDNEFLDKYCKLIIDNKDRKREKYKTQKHHIIPRCYFKYIDELCDDSKDNIVILLHKDHVLAHIYLSLIFTVKRIKYANQKAVTRCLNQKIFKENYDYVENVKLIESLEEYQQIMCESRVLSSELQKGRKSPMKGKAFSAEHRYKISQSNKGRVGKNKGKIKITNGETHMYISKDEQVPDGFWIGVSDAFRKNCSWNPSQSTRELWSKQRRGKGHPSTQEINKKISESNKGGIYINNGSITKHIHNLDEIDNYLNNGWSIGGLGKPGMSHSGTITVTNGMQEKRVKPEEAVYYLSNGWVRGRKHLYRKG